MLFSCGSAGKESICNVEDLGSTPRFNPWVRKIPWRREQLLTPVFWSGEFHGQYIAHGVAKSRIPLINFHSLSHSPLSFKHLLAITNLSIKNKK